MARELLEREDNNMFQGALISGNGGGGTPKCIWKASGLLKSDGTVINPIETKIIGVNSGTTNYNVEHDGIMLADIRTSDQSITYKGVTVQANPSNITPVSFL